MRGQKALLGQGNQELEMREMRPRDDLESWDGDAWQQAPADVLVHGHAFDDVDQKDVIGSRDAAPARA